MFNNLDEHTEHTFEETKSPLHVTSPTIPQKVKILDLNSPDVRSLLLENLKKIASPNPHKQQRKKGSLKKSIKVPPSFRVQLASDDSETMLIEAVSNIQPRCTQSRPPSRVDRSQMQSNVSAEQLKKALEKIFQQKSQSSPEYRMQEAIDDSCILFEVQEPASGDISPDQSYQLQTPQVSGLFDPQLAEMNISNPLQREQLVLKLAMLESNTRSERESTDSADEALDEYRAIDQSVILITNEIQEPPRLGEQRSTTPRPQLTLFDLSDQSHIRTLQERLEHLATDASQQQPRIKRDIEEQKQVAQGEVKFFIQPSSVEESPLLKTPNISECHSDHRQKVQPSELASKLNELVNQEMRSQSSQLTYESPSIGSIEDEDLNSGRLSVNQSATPVLMEMQPLKTDLQSPETQLGLFQKLAKLQRGQTSDFQQ